MRDSPAWDTAARRTAEGTAYVETGLSEALVFVHGVGMNRDVWAPQCSEFAGGYRAVAYDMLGHGESPLPPPETRLEDVSHQLAELLDALCIERAHLVGHSMGALVALDLALRAPDRVHDVVALNAVYRRTPEQRAAVLDRARRLAAGEVDDTVEETLDRWFGAQHRATQPGRVMRVRRWLEMVDKRGYARVYSCFAAADGALAGRLAALKVPALFMTGELDPNSTPEMTRRMAAESPNSELRVIPEQRHMMAYAAPQVVNPLIAEFLNRERVNGAVPAFDPPAQSGQGTP